LSKARADEEERKAREAEEVITTKLDDLRVSENLT